MFGKPSERWRDTSGVGTAPAPEANRTRLGFYGFLGFVADVSAIVAVFMQGITAVSIVLGVVGLLGALRLATTRLRGVRLWGVVLLLASLVVAAVMVIGPDRLQAVVQPDEGSDITGMTGGCEPFRVYAQNRWAPLGTKVLAAPTYGPDTEQVDAIAPNKVVWVDGWVRGNVAYPTNSTPWNSNVYFHLSDDSGWVTFAGVRAVPTSPDPTGYSPDGGKAVQVIDECEGMLQ